MKITVKKLEKRFLKRIPKKFRIPLSKYIDNKYVQETLNRAWKYELTDNESHKVFNRGRQKNNSEFFGLYYVACIYIHPLTRAQYYAGYIQRSMKVINS